MLLSVIPYCLTLNELIIVDIYELDIKTAVSSQQNKRSFTQDFQHSLIQNLVCWAHPHEYILHSIHMSISEGSLSYGSFAKQRF